MNAKQRRGARREVQGLEARLAAAEAARTALQERLAAAEEQAAAAVAERDRVAWDAADTQTRLERAKVEIDDLHDQVYRLRTDLNRAEGLRLGDEAELAQLRAEEHDSAKLRRRLEVRRIELDNANARIRELEAQVRQLTPPAPMIDLHRRPAS